MSATHKANGAVREESEESESQRLSAAIDRLEAVDVVLGSRVDMMAREVAAIKKALSSRVAVATAIMVLAGSVSSVWQGVKPLVELVRASSEVGAK